MRASLPRATFQLHSAFRTPHSALASCSCPSKPSPGPGAGPCASWTSGRSPKPTSSGTSKAPLPWRRRSGRCRCGGLRDERGAPRERFLARVAELAAPLAAARPTAVNLRWALDRMRRVAAQAPGEGAALWDRLKSEATAIWEEDRAMCRSIGEAGLPLVPDGAAVLTHCNAGALATGGIGTALAPVYLAHEAGRRVHVYVDETRPVLQGARLTAWELAHAGIRCTVIADAAAGALMRQAEVDLTLVGADRIAANGDFANKIGTYALAVLALHHGVPFYCAAPSTTIDATLADGDKIPIEQRPPDEVKSVAGRPVVPASVAALNPAFDVTPARYVTAYVTDRGIVQPPFGADGGAPR